MSLTIVEKLELLGFQFWEKKSSADPNVKETKDYFIVIQSRKIFLRGLKSKPI